MNIEIEKLMNCRRLPQRSSRNCVPANIATLAINDIEIKKSC
ncbi:hypothetical protein [Ignatzschineria cameli]|nr:hypothetical protein [Ignatzschineria cameli]